MIEVTVLGHACSMIRCGGKSVLCDPQLYDEFGGGLYAIYPKRQLSLRSMPAPDIVFISHHHRDHFNARSLAALDRATPIVIPVDEQIEYVLNALGFTDLNVVRDWDEVELDGARLVVTPSRYPTTEHGLLVLDEDAAVWSMVDSIVDAEIIASVKALAPRGVDLLLWPYQPLRETHASDSADLAFPARHFQSLLAGLRAIAPRNVMPYADGQFGAGPIAWMNHYRFPVSVEEVLAAVRAASPEVSLVLAPPGQRIEVRDGHAAMRTQADWIRPIALDIHDRDYDGTSAVPALVAATPMEWLATLGHVDALCAHLDRLWAIFLARPDGRAVLEAASVWELSYELLIEDAGVVVRRLRFAGGVTSIERLDGGVERSHNVAVMRIGQGVLERVYIGTIHLVDAYLAGLLRGFERMYRLEATGIVRPTVSDSWGAAAPPGSTVLSWFALLNLLFSSDEEWLQKILDSELERARRDLP